MKSEESEKLVFYLRSQYEGVFDEKTIRRHIDDYIGTTIAGDHVQHIFKNIKPGCRILDIGCGFGSFVFMARRAGLDAVGVELAEFEVDFARQRLAKERPQDDPEQIYVQGNAVTLPFPVDSFDVITLWNVLEHVPNYRALLAEAVRVLRPGGHIFGIAPNYLAIRSEPHYLLLWPSLLPRKLAIIYLKLRKRNPHFFQSNIFYCTNLGILWTLSRMGLKLHIDTLQRVENPNTIANPKIRQTIVIIKRLHLGWLLSSLFIVRYYNPFKYSVQFNAIKRLSK